MKKMAEIVVQEMQQAGLAGKDIRTVETEMRVMLREVGAAALGQYLEEQDEELGGQTEVCGCGEAMQALFKREARIISVFGRVSYRRRYHRCANCHVGRAPLDVGMGIEAGQVTAGLAELLALAGVEVAFEEATRWLERFLLFRVSDNTLRKETERFGELQQAEEALWQQQSQETSWLQARQREVGKRGGRLYGSLDGVMAPLQGEWRELKNIAWYRVETVRSYQKRRRHARPVGEQNDLQAQDISYHCDFKTGDKFSDLFWATACQRQADRYAELVFVCDGAVWIWRLADDRFPQARQRLDFYHAVQHLVAVGRALFGQDKVKFKTWIKPLAHQLKNHSAIKVIGQLEEALAGLQGQPAEEEVTREVNYFREHEKRMDYRAGARRGEPIGSGPAEATCRQMQCRFKRPGQFWSQQGDEALMCLETFWRNNRWHLLFPHTSPINPARN
jgi:hypothetical protein